MYSVRTPIDCYVYDDHTNKGMTEVVIMVSELSSLAGRHIYQPREEAVINHMLRFEKEWCKRVRKQYLEEQELHRPNCNRLQKLIQEVANIKVILDDKRPYQEQLTSLSQQYPQAKKELDNLPPLLVDIDALAEKKTSKPEQRAVVMSQVLKEVAQTTDGKGDDMTVKQQIQKTIDDSGVGSILSTHVLYGCLAEDKGLSVLGEFLHPRGWIEDIACRQQATSSSTVIDGTKVRIYGRVDAIFRQGDKMLVAENKNRKNRLFTTNPSYDIDQLALYVFTLGASHSLLHQYYNGRSSSTFYSKEFMEERVQEILTTPQLLLSLQEIVALKRSDYEHLKMRSFVEKYLLEEKM